MESIFEDSDEIPIYAMVFQGMRVRKYMANILTILWVPFSTLDNISPAFISSYQAHSDSKGITQSMAKV